MLTLRKRLDEALSVAIEAAKPATEFDGGEDLMNLANEKLGSTGAVCSRVKVFRMPWGGWHAKAYMEGGNGTPYTTGWCFLNQFNEGR